MRMLVTGGAGFVGAEVTRRLADRGRTVRGRLHVQLDRIREGKLPVQLM